MQKKSSRILLIPVLFLALAGILFAAVAARNAGALPPLKMTLLKVGKADAIVLQTEEQVMVVDAGEEEDGAEIVQFLRQQNLEKIDILLITHFDRDHVGGADTLAEQLEIGRVLLPAYEGTHPEYFDFLDALAAADIAPERLTEPLELELGSAHVLVEPPRSYEVTDPDRENDNDFSLITTVTHGENRFLLTGDIEKRRIRDWLQTGQVSQCNFLKVPHHGIYSAALPELLDAVQPKYAAICSSNKNPADPAVLELLEQRGIRPMETRFGNISVISSGRHLEIHQERKK